MTNYCFTDLETGGLRSDENPVLQIGAIVTDENFKELDTFNSFIKPPKNLLVTEEALKINQIDIKKLDNEKSEAEVFRDFNSFLLKHDKPILVGFNLGFDITFLKSIAYRNKIHLVSSGLFLDLQSTCINTLEGFYKYSLKSTCEFLGVKADPNHTALNDARACIQIAKIVL